MKPIIVTSGDPAGVGPDICVALAQQSSKHPIVVCGDIHLLRHRASVLKTSVQFVDYPQHKQQLEHGQLLVHHIPTSAAVTCGQMNAEHAKYILEQINYATQRCLHGDCDAMITSPVNKACINQAGIRFSGHTEYLAEQCNTDAVMMFAGNSDLRIALVTTHIPLAQVTAHIDAETFRYTILCAHTALKRYCRIQEPRLGICGINPHAGEDGYLGHEEQQVLQAVIEELRHDGFNVSDPLPADTIFTQQQRQQFDLIVTMFHDQGLPVMKAVHFGELVNITLGLPFLRTSVDHGTAYTAAKQRMASPQSLLSALRWTEQALANDRTHETN